MLKRTPPSSDTCKLIFAVASEGGHFEQLLRLHKSFEDLDHVYITTNDSYEKMLDAKARFHVISDGNRNSPLRLIRMLLQLAILFARYRPAAVITTGAAPGYFACRLGRLFRARTIWIDSIANAEELSMSGRLALPFADVRLTQWKHLEDPDIKLLFKGSVL